MFNKIFTKLGLFLAVALTLLLIYLPLTSNTATSFADADEFLSVGSTWGLAHPPGYIWQTTFLHILYRLGNGLGGYEWLANASSGLMIAVCLGLLGVLIFEREKSDSKIHWILIYLSSVSIGLTSTLYSQALTFEKYPMAMLVLTLTLFRFNKPKSEVWLGVLLGLSLFVHQSLIFLLPIFGYKVYYYFQKKETKKVIWFGGYALLAVTVSILLTFYRGTLAAEPSWKMGNTIVGLVNTLSRADFVGQIYTKGIESNGFVPKITLTHLISGFSLYGKITFNSYGWLLFGIVIAGLLITASSAIKNNDKQLLIWIGSYLLMGLVVAGYLGKSEDIGTIAITSRFYLISVPLSMLFVYELARLVFSRIRQSAVELDLKFNGELLGALVLLLVALSQLYRNTITNLATGTKVVGIRTKIVLESLPSNSILTCYSDISCFSAIYFQKVKHLREDISLVPLQFPLVEREIESKGLQRFNYAKNPFKNFDIVSNALAANKRVFAIDMNQYYSQMYGIDQGVLYSIPYEYVTELVKVLPAEIEESKYQMTPILKKEVVSPLDYWQRQVFSQLAFNHYMNGYVFLRLGERERAVKEMSIATDIMFRLTSEEKEKGMNARATIEQTLKSDAYKYGKQGLTDTQLMGYVPELLKRNYNSRALLAVRGALMINPTNTNARLELARMYGLMGDKNFSRMEYENVLKIDPSNSSASGELVKLNGE